MVDRRGKAGTGIQGEFLKWAESSLLDPSMLEVVDWEKEIAGDLTLSEAIEMAIRKFPNLWKEDAVEKETGRARQIVFIGELVKKIRDGEVKVTYRTSPKLGRYYVTTNRFRPASTSDLAIEVYRTEKVDPEGLTDEDARLAGVESKERIIKLFRKWYGDPIPVLYRNWFRIVTP